MGFMGVETGLWGLEIGLWGCRRWGDGVGEAGVSGSVVYESIKVCQWIDICFCMCMVSRRD